MKTRNFILSMFMMMFCSFAFGQNWGDFNYHNYPNNMTVNAVVSIDGELQSNADLTIAPYYGDERRGEPTNAKLTMTGQYMAEVLIYGETNGENITFKLYDGECMYDNLADYNVDFTADAVYGDLRNPVAVNFKAIAQVADKKYGSLDKAISVATAGQTVKLLTNVEREYVEIPANVALDLNGNTIKADIVGSILINNGLWITKEGYKMIGNGADYYQTTDAKIVMGENYSIEMVSGTVTLAKDLWYTLDGQNITIDQGAVFNIKNGQTFVVNGSEVVNNGTVNNAGTIQILPGATVKGNVTGNIAFKGGNYITAENFKMVGTDANYYYNATDATINIAANGDITIASGYMTLGQSWRTLPNQTVTVATGATFNVPSGMKYQIYGTAIVNGTIEIEGNVELAHVNATLKAVEGLNITSGIANYYVIYKDNTYSLSHGVARIGDVYYNTLAEALNAVQDGETITLIKDINEDVTVVQAPNVKITIDGAGTTYTGTITVNGKSQAYATAALNIINVNFDTKNITKDASINLGGSNNIRYTSNVTVEKCSFVGTNQTKAGIKNYTGGCKNLIVSNCTTDGLHSLVQVKGIEGITVADVTIKNGKNGISVGTSTNVNIKNSTINVTGYGVRADGTGACNMTIAENTINANLPIVVREATGAYNLTVEGGSYTASNEKGAAVTFTTGDDGTFLAPTSDATATIIGDVTTFGFEARIGNVYYTTFAKAKAAAQTGNTITVISPVVVAENTSYDLEGIKVEGENVFPIFRIVNDATMTLSNANITNPTDYVFVLGASDGSSAGNLTINSGSYAGTVSVASVTKGALTINGGEFKANASEYNAQYLINCIDANYADGSATVAIKGGKFYSFNPENNAAEGAGTDFCPEGYVAIYDANEDSYTVISAVAKIGETYYSKLSSAIAAVKNGETIEFISTISENVTIKQTANKSFTIDGAGQTYTGTITVDGNKRSTGAETLTIKNVNFVAEGQWQSSILASKNTYVHNVTVDACTFTGTDAKEVYGIRLYSSFNITVKNTTGTKLYDLVYAQTAVNGFVAENITVTESVNGFWFPYGVNPLFKNITISETVELGIGICNNNSSTATIENCNIAAETAVYLGEYNNATKSYRLIFNGTNTFGENWLKVEGTAANFKVVANDEGLDMTKTSGLAAFEGNNYYNTLAYAVKDAAANVTVLKAHEITKTAVVEKDMTIDFNNKAITGNVYPVVRVQNNANVTVENGNINNNDYVFVLGAADGSSAGNLTIVDGEYAGTVTVASVTKGTLAIEGGVFKANASEYDAQYLINCIDANYNDDSANVSITGGTFYGFDPENNAAEGAGTNFCADGYLSVDNGDGSYTVRRGDYVAEITGGAKYESLQAAIDAAVTGDEVVILKDLTYSWENTFKVENTYDVLANVSGKDITLNMNGKTISVDHQSTTDRIYAVVYVGDGAGLTVTGNGYIDVNVHNTTPKVAYMFWKRGTTGHLTIENGNYHMDNSEDSMLYSNGDDIVIVKGGTFVLDNAGTGPNHGFPWIFNATGNNQRSIYVIGGTYNYNITEQYWKYEVNVPNGYAIRNNGDGTWTVVSAVAYIIDENENKVNYETLASAIAAVKNGETIVLIAAIDENVTIKQQAGLSFTIDGNGQQYAYSGTIKIIGRNVTSAAETLTIKNVKFEDTSATTYDRFIDATNNNDKNGYTHNVTIENCSFKSNNWHYAIYTRHPNDIVINNCTAENVYYFIYNPQGGDGMTVENCTVTGATYGIGAQKLMNVSVKNYTYSGKAAGFYGRAYANYCNTTLENVNITTTMQGQAAVALWKNNDGNTSKMYTFNFLGGNVLTAPEGTPSFTYQSDTNSPFTLVLGAEDAIDATVKATEGIGFVSGDDDYIVNYVNGTYSLIPGSVLNETQNKRYATIQDAIDASNAGDIIKLLANVSYDKNDMFAADVYGYTIMINVTGKNIVLDLNGYTISTDVEDSTDLLYSVVFVGDNGSLTLRDSSEEGTGTIIAKAGMDAGGKGNIYSLIMADTKTTQNVKINIESGNYELDESRNSGALVYVNISNILTVTGGNFYLGNAGTLANNSPWIFNTYSNGVNHVIVKGGNYNVTPLHYWGEVIVPAEYTVVVTDNVKYPYSVVPAQRQTLEAGWSWFSSYINISGKDGLDMIKASIGNNGEQIKNQFNSTRWDRDTTGVYNNGEYFWFGSLEEVSVTEMLMIKTTAPVELVLGGDIVNPAETPITLNNNWTWIGYPVAEEMNIEDALENIIPNDGDIIKSQNGIAQYYAEWNTWYSQSLTSMTPGMGYMYKNNGEEQTLVYPTPNANSRAAVKANVTSEDNHWAPNASAFANNMNIIAVLESNDMMGEFEVAAFVNGEVRGSARPTYVEPIDAYVLFMTIYGEEGEEMTFKYYDIYSDEEHSINNTVNYSDNAVIGSIREPYMFFANTLGMDEKVANTLSIYPNPTTTNTAISFETTFDMVEVFNSLGAKVAEYRNVDRIEGMEAAGVYVIRVTNDSAVQNCRLIVK